MKGLISYETELMTPVKVVPKSIFKINRINCQDRVRKHKTETIPSLFLQFQREFKLAVTIFFHKKCG